MDVGITQAVPLIGACSVTKGGRTALEAPQAIVEVQDVVITAHQLHGPTGVAQQHEDKITTRLGFVVRPLGHDRVDHEMALGPPGLPLGIGLPKRVVALMGPHARELTDPFGAEGGHHIIGAAVIEGLGVGGDRGAHTLGHLGVRSLSVHSSSLPGRWCRFVHRHPVRDQARRWVAQGGSR